MITPYNTDGTVSLETAEKYVDWYFENGLDGIFAICQSSEIFKLSLEERVSINATVYKRAKKLEMESGRKFTVISSGHISDSPEAQAEELNAIYASGTDALIFITNRLAGPEDGDSVLIANAERLMSQLPKAARLGFYECPLPYKRLLTERTLSWAADTGRFDYIKDTCCDAALIKKRCEQLKGSGIKLLNANCQTLLESLNHGADGYCGIMCNFHPRLYSLLGEMREKNPEKAEILQSYIGTFGFTEVGMPYPLTAKYNMSLCGIKTENIARTRKSAELNDYVKSCVEQMKLAADYLERMLLK